MNRLKSIPGLVLIGFAGTVAATNFEDTKDLLFIFSVIACAMLSAYLRPWVNNLIQNILEILTYVLVVIITDNVLSVVGVVILMFYHIMLFEPRAIRPYRIVDQKFSLPIGIALIGMKVPLLIYEIPSGYFEISEIPSPFLPFAYGTFVLVIATLLFQYHRKKYDKLETLLAQKEKDWTLSVMSLLSHNIRTPIAAITNLSEIMRLKLTQNHPVSETEVKQLQNSTDQVMSIVNQLLSKSARNLMRKGDKFVEVAAVMEHLETERVRIENPKGFGFHISSTHAITLELCLDSLISNALKYSNEEVIVLVDRKDNEYRLHVIDRGQGMNEEELKRYGTPFNSNSTTGTGLGVYLVLELITSQGWRWSINSTKGTGTTVTLHLPKERLLV